MKKKYRHAVRNIAIRFQNNTMVLGFLISQHLLTKTQPTHYPGFFFSFTKPCSVLSEMFLYTESYILFIMSACLYHRSRQIRSGNALIMFKKTVANRDNRIRNSRLSFTIIPLNISHELFIEDLLR